MNSAGRQMYCWIAYRAPMEGEGSTSRERRKVQSQTWKWPLRQNEKQFDHCWMRNQTPLVTRWQSYLTLLCLSSSFRNEHTAEECIHFLETSCLLKERIQCLALNKPGMNWKCIQIQNSLGPFYKKDEEKKKEGVQTGKRQTFLFAWGLE